MWLTSNKNTSSKPRFFLMRNIHDTIPHPSKWRYIPSLSLSLSPGFDRLMAVLCQTPTLRDVIAFPKSFYGKDLLSGAPSEIHSSSLAPYHITTTTLPHKHWYTHSPIHSYSLTFPHSQTNLVHRDADIVILSYTHTEFIIWVIPRGGWQ